MLLASALEQSESCIHRITLLLKECFYLHLSKFYNAQLLQYQSEKQEMLWSQTSAQVFIIVDSISSVEWTLWHIHSLNQMGPLGSQIPTQDSVSFAAKHILNSGLN